MDLSFRPFLPDHEIALPPRDLALLVAAATAARATCATVRVQAILDAPFAEAPRPADDRFAPACGSFDAAVAAALWRWKADGRRTAEARE